MERYTDAPYQRDWYIFEEKYRLVIWECMIEINGIDSPFREGKKLSTIAPYISIPMVGTHLLQRAIVQTEFPFNIDLSGKHVGTYSHNTGYEAAAEGRLSRPIVEVSISIDLNAEFLQVGISCLATAIEQEPSGSPLHGSYLAPIRFQYLFDIPVSEVPGFLNMDEDMRFRFSKVLSKLS